MRFGHLELPVADPMASQHFYVDVLGFELEALQGDRFAWVKLGDFEILLRPAEDGAELASKHDVVLYSNDVEADAQRLHAHGLETELRANCYHFEDPDGHRFQLVDPAADHSA
jgi:catechol 2,3-dioxygenase-like lactoylglutathione lyase family enzyme